MSAFASLSLVLLVVGQAPPTIGGVADDPAARLKFMKQAVEVYKFLPADSNIPLRRQDEPAFRLGKQPADTVVDGAIFFWAGANGRPEAAMQAFLAQHSQEPLGAWFHEFTSLSTGTMNVTRGGRAVWQPSKPGVAFKTIPDAPKPGETEAQRTRQMTALAKTFRASDDFKAKGWSELRGLPKPIARYGKAGTDLIDGALFAFVLGTDPEVLLFLEVRPGKDGPEWQYAFAPMTVFAVKGTFQGRLVWELPDRQRAGDPTQPFLNTPYIP